MSVNSAHSVSIYVIGPSSTGKTTLCNALAQKLGLPKTAYVTEVARSVMKEKGYSRHTISMVQMQKDIMDAYLLREDDLESRNEPIRLFDRSALDPIVYAMLTSETAEEANWRKSYLIEANSFRKMLEKYRSSKSIFILLHPIEEWKVDDGVRTLENQDKCFSIFKALLDNLKVDYYEFGSHTKFIGERVILTLGFAKF